MNPDTTIRTWLLACGSQFGIHEAHEYRWADDDTRQVEPFCTYRSVDIRPVNDATMNLSTKAQFTATNKYAQEFVSTWEIDLFNSQDGLYELAAFSIGAKNLQSLKNIFDTGNCAFAGAISITNETRTDEDEITDYHFRLTCQFREFVELGISESNAIVDEIVVQLDSEYGEYTIDENGIT